MGRARMVTRSGATRAAAAITAVTATAAVLLAGCGTRSAGQPAGARVPAATATPASAGPPAGSRAGARGLAGLLLARLILPPGARPVRMPVLPPSLRQPSIIDGGTHQVDMHRLFLVSEPLSAVQDFLEAHLPAGMELSGQGQAAGPGGTTMGTVSYQPRALAAGMNYAELDITVAPAASGGSLLRADAAVVWYPVRSAAEWIDPARYRAAVVSVSLFNPRRRTVRRTVTSGAVIARLAGLVNGLHAAPYQPPSCPAILASYQITFVPVGRSSPQAVVTPTGCLTVGVTVAGAAQPLLWDDTGLIHAATRLLHVKPGLN